MFAQNLYERAALNKKAVELVSSAQTEERSVKQKKKKTNFCVKNNVWTTNVFKP